MPSALSQSCMQFRLETLAPSGGWLASVAIGLSIKTGIYEYTILAIIFMISFIILRTASCESAMVLALAYDLVIPFQYQNVQRHLAELEKYWPKFLLATAVEAGCYLLLTPDLFNLAVIIKTSVLLIVWMKGKKQYPLNLAKDRQPPPTTTQPASVPREPSKNLSSSSGVTDDYLKYVMGELQKCTGEAAVTPERAQEHISNLRKEGEDPKRKNTEKSLKNRKIMLFKDWQAAQGGGGTTANQSQGTATQGAQASAPKHISGEMLTKANEELKAAGTMEDVPRKALMKRLQKPLADPDWEVARKELEAKGVKMPSAQEIIKTVAESQATAGGGEAAAGNQPQAANHTQRQNPSGPANIEYQYTTPTDAELEQVKLDLKSAGSSIKPQDIIEPLKAGPKHPKFPFTINYLRNKGISTRKWIPMAPADKTMYRVPDHLQDSAMKVIAGLNPKATPPWVVLLKGGYNTFDELKQAMEYLRKISSNYISIKLPEDQPDQCKFDRVAPDGNIWHDYARKIDEAMEEGEEEMTKVEALYDFMCDPNTIVNPAKPDPNMDKWREANELEWATMLEHKTVDENDYIIGGGPPTKEIKEYRKQLNAVGNYPQTVIDAIIRDVKNSSTPQEGRDSFKAILGRSHTNQGVRDVIKSYDGKIKVDIEHAQAIKESNEKPAAAAAAAAASAGSG